MSSKKNSAEYTESTKKERVNNNVTNVKNKVDKITPKSMFIQYIKDSKTNYIR